MVDVFQSYLAANGNFTAAEAAQLEAAAIPKQLRRRQLLLRRGEVCHYVAFVVRGCLRLYRTDEAGEEHILRFAVENWWLNDSESFRTGRPAQGSIDALEATQVLLWSRESWAQLKSEIPTFDALDSRLMSRTLDTQLNRLYSAISDSAEVRYQAFVKAFPAFYQRIPLHMIASYLGVTRETLSRIRRRHNPGQGRAGFK